MVLSSFVLRLKPEINFRNRSIYGIMSESELGKAKPSHNERRNAATSYACGIIGSNAPEHLLVGVSIRYGIIARAVLNKKQL